ncbi:anaerobic sulfatase maturase [Vibrio sp. ZSDE26]|uniref:Anaerobic sulfatase maturase n=1 Tax=Vibrio amylolyticus TaxID=2847292 RepID=A0A9X1XMX2_9VIBR|nr:anaerobic sulfatase maturase [Vibrio amylolyticus]MCK6264448.1 anaerobic sulfatase maturase [Vibrio amylolyticus]
MEVSKSVHVMSKPTGSVCNLDCDYCFYLEKDKLYPDRNSNWKMSDATLEVYIKQHIEAQYTQHVTFAWQGGEPLMMGIEFFQKALLLQQVYANGKSIENTLQTNGLLLNDEWCKLFKEHHFLIGISVDGPEHLHDKYRTNRSGKGSYQKVKQAIQLLQTHQVEFNTLTVVGRHNVDHGLEVYQHLKSLGSHYHQYIPLVERSATKPTVQGIYLVSPEHEIQAQVTEWSVDSLKFGQFLSEIFEYWVKHDVGSVFVPYFENTLAGWSNEKGSMCTLAPRCGSAFALESNGDVYNCDHYVYPEFKLGNIHSKSIGEMNFSQQNYQFGIKKKDINSKCSNCKYLKLCNGGCPKQRFIPRIGESAHNYLCEGYEYFFSHSEVKMKQMRDLWVSGKSPIEIMHI